MAFFLLGATALAALMDFAVGALIAFTIERATGMPGGLLDYFVGGVLGLLPDIDIFYLYAVWWFKKSIRSFNHHQFITHRPIVMIPTATIIGFLVGGFPWAQIAGLCVFWHLLHDSKGFLGGGIAWFWPFSHDYISVWPPFRHENSKKNSSMSDDDNKHRSWLIQTYLQPNRPFAIELSIAFAALAIIITLHFHLPFISGFLFFCLCWGLVTIFQNAAKSYMNILSR